MISEWDHVKIIPVRLNLGGEGIRRHGVLGEIHAGSENFISILGLDVYLFCALSCIVSGGGPDIVLTAFREVRTIYIY